MAITVSPAVSGVRACVFDAYGTLLDLASAVEPHAAALGEAAPRLLALWRAKQLEYTWLRTLMERHADFARVTEDALECACAALDIQDLSLRRRLLTGFLELAAYPDAAQMLRHLRARGLRTAVLSNGTPAMLERAFARAGLAPLLDSVLSVETVGFYKPSPRVYHFAAEALGLERGALLFVSANAWDAAGAASAGLRAVWVNRAGAPPERLPVGPAFTLRALGEVPALLGAGPEGPPGPMAA
ncbi:MAG: haloacid dehalogenase type II [Gemmatimonadales bacterium]